MTQPSPPRYVFPDGTSLPLCGDPGDPASRIPLSVALAEPHPVGRGLSLGGALLVHLLDRGALSREPRIAEVGEGELLPGLLREMRRRAPALYYRGRAVRIGARERALAFSSQGGFGRRAAGIFARGLPLKDASLDLLLAEGSAEVSLPEVARVLSPGGIALWLSGGPGEGAASPEATPGVASLGAAPPGPSPVALLTERRALTELVSLDLEVPVIDLSAAELLGLARLFEGEGVRFSPKVLTPEELAALAAGLPGRLLGIGEKPARQGIFGVIPEEVEVLVLKAPRGPVRAWGG